MRLLIVRLGVWGGLFIAWSCIWQENCTHADRRAETRSGFRPIDGQAWFKNYKRECEL
jgi:hypothetical protein